MLTVALFRVYILLYALIHRQSNHLGRLMWVQCNRVPMKQSHWLYFLAHLDQVVEAHGLFSPNKIDSHAYMCHPSTRTKTTELLSVIGDRIGKSKTKICYHKRIRFTAFVHCPRCFCLICAITLSENCYNSIVPLCATHHDCCRLCSMFTTTPALADIRTSRFFTYRGQFQFAQLRSYLVEVCSNWYLFFQPRR